MPTDLDANPKRSGNARMFLVAERVFAAVAILGVVALALMARFSPNTLDGDFYSNMLLVFITSGLASWYIFVRRLHVANTNAPKEHIVALVVIVTSILPLVFVHHTPWRLFFQVAAGVATAYAIHLTEVSFRSSLQGPDAPTSASPSQEPPGWWEKHWRGAARAGAGAVILIFVAMGLLPILYVQSSAFEVEVTPTATPTVLITVAPAPSGPPSTATSTINPVPTPTRSTDLAARTAARNDARIPIGVTAAALVAATAAGFGVHASRKSVGAAHAAVIAADARQVSEAAAAEARRASEAAAAKDRQGVELAAARARHVQQDEQWRQEQFAKRFADAARQLGSDRGAERLAGVYSMAQLADEWEEQRERCIDVLCGAFRLSSDGTCETDKVVRRAIISEIRSHTRVDFDKRHKVHWRDMGFNLSNTTIHESIRLDDVKLRRFDLSRCQINATVYLVRSEVTEIVQLLGATAHKNMDISITGSGIIRMDDFTIAGQATVSLAQTDAAKNPEGRFRIKGNPVRVQDGASLQISVSRLSETNSIELHGLEVSRTATLTLSPAKWLSESEPPVFEEGLVSFFAHKIDPGATVNIDPALADVVPWRPRGRIRAADDDSPAVGEPEAGVAVDGGEVSSEDEQG